MTVNIYLVHRHYDPVHLAEVMADMLHGGPATVQAVWVEAYGAYVALEGCHRLRAAVELGVPVRIDALDYDTLGGDYNTECGWTLDQLIAGAPRETKLAVEEA